MRMLPIHQGGAETSSGQSKQEEIAKVRVYHGIRFAILTGSTYVTDPLALAISLMCHCAPLVAPQRLQALPLTVSHESELTNITALTNTNVDCPKCAREHNT